MTRSILLSARHGLSRAAVAVLLITLAACGGGGGGSSPAAVQQPPVAQPTVTSVTPSTVTPPGRVTLAGANLERVTQARLGSAVLPIVSQASAALVLDVPTGVSTNFITLAIADGSTVQSSQQLTISTSMSVTSFAPATVLAGATLTVNGTGLDRTTAVEFSGGASAPVATRSGTTSFTVTVPSGAVSGPIILIGASERVPSPNSLTVVPRIVVSNATANTAAPGDSVTLSGGGFTEVSSVTVGGAMAAVSARNATTITFVVPASVTCGAIVLQSSSQPAVNGGSVVANGGCTLRLDAVDFAQVLSQPAPDSYARLVPRKRTMVRAYVVAATGGIGAPTVRLTGFNGTTTLGSLDMSGPAQVPQLAAGTPLPDTLRYEEGATYNAILPADWTSAGLRLQITVDPEGRYGAPLSRTETPMVGSRTRIELVIVPLVSGGFVPNVSAAGISEAVNELTRAMPVARENISVTLRQPYTLTSVTDGVDTSAEWSSALQELRNLRATEGQGRHYYGMVAPVVASGIAGIGYVNPLTSSAPALAALGWDMSRSTWRRTMLHEMGHNYSRAHAPCGSVDGADPSYPYAGGAMSATPLFDSLADNVVAPTSTGSNRDVMGYCNGLWFSDYNFREVQRFLERQPQPALDTALDVASAGELLLIAGAIGLDGVRLAPVHVSTGLAEVQAAGEYTLRITVADGRELELPFDAVPVDHAMPPEKHFVVRVPNPGPLAGVEVRRGPMVVARADAAQVRVQAAAAAARAAKASTATSVVQWTEAGGRLRLQWDATAYPVLAVSHLAGERRVLALGLRGGQAELSTASLPPGGTFEFSLSDGLNAVRSTGAR